MRKGDRREKIPKTSSSSLIIISLRLREGDFAASSLALPILRAALVADAPHVYFQYLARVHRYNTKVLVSLGSHPSPLPRGLFTVYEPPRVPSLVPLALHHLLSADTVYEVPQYLCSPV